MNREPPSQEELQALSDRLMVEFAARFRSSNLDLDIGRIRWLFSRGIGLEVNGEFYSVTAAVRPIVRRGWRTLLDLEGVEQTVRAYLEAQVRLYGTRPNEQ